MPNQEKDNLTGYGVLDLSRDGAGGEEPENIVQLFIDNTLASEHVYATESTFTITMAAGAHTVQAKARYKGTWFDSAIVHFTVKKPTDDDGGDGGNPPVEKVTVTVTSPSEGQEIFEGNFDFKVKVTVA